VSALRAVGFFRVLADAATFSIEFKSVLSSILKILGLKSPRRCYFGKLTAFNFKMLRERTDTLSLYNFTPKIAVAAAATTKERSHEEWTTGLPDASDTTGERDDGAPVAEGDTPEED
jgi:hypothetical protein